MAKEAIEEYLQTSAYCLGFVKAHGGCLGYPAALLLFCVTNALGVFLKGDVVTIDGRPQRITDREPFRVFNHDIFGLQLSSERIKLLEKRYRNKLAHNAIIGIGTFMTRAIGPTPPFIFGGNKSQQIQSIQLDPFQQLVENAWKKFPKERLPRD